MKNRREFIKISALGGAGLIASSCTNGNSENVNAPAEQKVAVKPIVVSTWYHGLAANDAAWEVLNNSGTALDAVEAGVKIPESDPENTSVGLGGLPDRDGNVTLDACIMDHQNNCGAVAYLHKIEHPISVARKVMEETPHVMLVGEGAHQFALNQGFKEKELLTKESKEAWKKWLKKAQYKPEINRENHDTIGMLAIDEKGNLSGACTTSGMAYKMNGRVGDSPIIGAGLFVDNEVGAACATGVGEAVIRVAGSAMIVELMRSGKSPKDACKEVINRIIKTHADLENLQVGFIALNKHGEYGCYGIHKGFEIAVKHQEFSDIVESDAHLKS